jgi:uncharacterized RDD family membrane protein YckC
MLPRLYRRHDRHPGLNSPIDTIITAETPEGIAISIRPAGFAVRCTAFLIDAVIRAGILMACAAALDAGGSFGSGMMFIVLFLINWMYPVMFELTPAAATPGKRIMGLYVVMASGLPITPAGCLIRNLLRVVDLLPVFYAFGIVSMLLRRDARRLGDLAAATVVAYRDEVQLTGMLGDGEPMPPPMPLSPRQQLAITAFAFRVGRLTPERAEEIAALAAVAAPGLTTASSAPGASAPGASATAVAAVAGTAPAQASLTMRLIGVARWLHGQRPVARRAPAAP